MNLMPVATNFYLIQNSLQKSLHDQAVVKLVTLKYFPGPRVCCGDNTEHEDDAHQRDEVRDPVTIRCKGPSLNLLQDRGHLVRIWIQLVT